MIFCKFENGSKAHLRHIVTGAIIVKDEKVLLIKRGFYNGKPLLESGKWAIVGGYLDLNETLEEGIRREIREETGYEVGSPILFHINDNPDRPHEDRQNVAVNYIFSANKQSVVKSEEVMEMKWFNLDKLPSKEEFAFDHYGELMLYKKYLKKQFPLPVVE